MGIDEIAIDFSDMDGLIALAGPTGIGKSTVMENLHPYPRLVSRPQPTLKNHVCLRDSFKELEFMKNGDHIRTLTKIDSHSGRSEGYIYVNGSESSLNDGKITSYSEAITEMFGSTDLFFNSVFCAQNSEKMSAMDPADLKALFVEFLGRRLEILVEQENTSKSCSNHILNAVESIDRDIKRQDQLIETYADTDQDLRKAVDDRDGLEKELEAKKQSVSDQAKRKADLEDQKKAQETNEQAIKDLEKRYTEYEGDLAKIQLDLTNDTREPREKREISSKALDEVEEILKDKPAVLTAVKEEALNLHKITENEHTLSETSVLLASEAETLDKEKKEYSDLRAKYSDREKEFMQKKEADAKLISELQIEIAKKKNAIAEKESDTSLALLQNELKTALEKVLDLDKRGTVSCQLHGDEVNKFQCNTEDCIFVERALKAHADIPGLKERIGAREKELNESIKAFRDGLTTDLIDLKTVEGSLEMTETDITALQVDRDKVLEDVANRGSLTADRVRKLKEQIERMEKELLECRGLDQKYKKLLEKKPEIDAALLRQKDLEGTIQDIDKHIEALELRALEKKSEIHKHMDQVDEDIDRLRGLRNPKIDSEIRAITLLISGDETEIEILEKNIKEKSAEITRLELFQDRKKEAEAELKSLRERRDLLANEQAQWFYLQNKCGKDGLRALEIASVAPSIAADANSLLEQAFGAWAMVDFQTLDDEGKEVLRPVCIDQDGDTVLVANRSGGQQVWAMKAMRLAMTMVSKQKSGRNYQTGYADEDDAGLDIETAMNFTRLYRAFMEQGEFAKVFFVSHKPQCVDLSDHVVRLGEGGVVA